MGTTAQRPTAAEGMIRLNSSDSVFEGYNNGQWRGLGGIIDVDRDTYITTEFDTDDDSLYFYTAGEERGRIGSDGVVSFEQTVSASNPTAVSHLTTKSYVDSADTNLQSQITSNDGDISTLNADLDTLSCLLYTSPSPRDS